MQTLTTEQQQEQTRPVWSWRFENIDDLRLALTEYTSFLDGTLTRHYGDRLDRSDQLMDADVEMHQTQRRAEVDACMVALETDYPLYHRLLSMYYCSGASTEFGAWKDAARRIGMRRAGCPSQVRCPIRSRGD